MVGENIATIKMELLGPYNATMWDSIVAESSRGTVFHSTDWLGLSRGVNLSSGSPRAISLGPRMIMLTADGEPAGTFAGVECSILGFRALISPAPRTFTPYGGLVVREQQMEGTSELPALLMKSLLKQYRIIVATDPPIIPAKEWSKQYIVKNTYVLDLTIPAKILRLRIKERTERSIRRAERSGVSVLEGSNESHVESYYDLWKQTARRKNIGGLLPLSYYIDAFRKLGRDRAKLLLALHGDKPVAAVFLLCDNKRLYYWTGASGQTGLRLGASSLLQWRAILLGKEIGLREYDMVGGNIPSVAFFKAGFGGSRHSYYRFIITRPGPLGILVRKSLQLFGL